MPSNRPVRLFLQWYTNWFVLLVCLNFRFTTFFQAIEKKLEKREEYFKFDYFDHWPISTDRSVIVTFTIDTLLIQIVHSFDARLNSKHFVQIPLQTQNVNVILDLILRWLSGMFSAAPKNYILLSFFFVLCHWRLGFIF